MKTRHSLSVASDSVYPDYPEDTDVLVTDKRLSIAKWQAAQLFDEKGDEIRRRFTNYALRKYRCKRRQIKFDNVGAVRRIKRAVLCYDDEEIWGRTDGHTIEISAGYMSYPQLVGTLLHESLHDWCRVRGRVMSCAGEHFCMHKCGDPNE